MAKAIAPEDLRRGDYVAVTSETIEFPAFLLCGEAWNSPDGMLRSEALPVDAGVPLKVREICLPFVMVRRPAGEYDTLDVRRCRLARLDRGFATASWKALERRDSAENKKRCGKQRRGE